MEAVDAALAVFLARRVEEAELPTRIVNWAGREKLLTLRDLALRDPDALLDVPNLGRKSIADTSGFFSLHTGKSWEDLHAQVAAPRSTPSLAEQPSAEDIERAAWPLLPSYFAAEVLAQPVRTFDLPTRMLNHCERSGIATLGQLLACAEADLRNARNLGRTSLRDTRRALARLWDALARPEASRAASAPKVEDFATFFALWRKQVAELGVSERMVLTQRVGDDQAVPTLAEVGDLLGVSRERVRQLEAAAIKALQRGTWWIDGVVGRIEDAYVGGAVSLRMLAEDPWFAGIEQRPHELRFLLTRVDERICVIPIGDETYLSRTSRGDVEAATERARALLDQVVFPISCTELDAQLAECWSLLPGSLAVHIAADIQAELHRADVGGWPMYMGVGDSRLSAVLAFVRASDVPVSVHALEERFGRGALPNEVVHVARGAVMAPERIPDFALWQERLADACARVMAQEGAERQWSSEELLERLEPLAQLPAWLNPWHLAGMLRLSGKVTYLGRLRFCPIEQQREGRAYIHEVAREVLRAAGKPLSDADLRERVVQRTAVSDLAWSSLATGARGGVIRVDDGAFGLVDRDVPGGEAALVEAEDVLVTALRGRDTGLSLPQACAALVEANDQFRAYTAALVHALARRSTRLRTSHNGAVGLVEWDDVRVPGVRAMLRQALSELGGRVPIDVFVARVAALHGTRPTRPVLASLAISSGARVRGEVIVDDAVAASQVALEPVSETPLNVPAVADIPSFPEVAAEAFAQLLQKPVQTAEALRAACAAHVRAFEEQARTNEFVSLDEARTLATACGRLIDKLELATSDEPRRLISATVAYFALVDDGDSDFSIGGLDDDLAVFSAVAAYLGFEGLLEDDVVVPRVVPAAQVEARPLESEQVPQANRLDRVVARVREAMGAAGGSADGALRDAHYYSQAAQVLGLLDGAHEPTAEGRAVVHADEPARRTLLVTAFEQSRVGKRWLAFTGKVQLAEVDPGSAEAFLQACSVLAPSTAARRGGTLRHWWAELFRPVNAPVHLRVEHLAELSAASRSLLERLSSEPLEPATALLGRVADHVRKFRIAARTSEFVDLDEAEEIERSLVQLLPLAEAAGDEARRLVQGAARYFLLVDDADTDFYIGGLADDLAVVRAVARSLGAQELAMAQP
jgi:Bacterial RNA polymerase, alpha chain C terminal domain/Sigma-70, region 4